MAVPLTANAAPASERRKAAPFASRTYLSSNTTNFNINQTSNTKPQLRKNSIVAAMDRHDRTSFSSIKESDSNVAQSFTTTKTSSLLRQQLGVDDEDAIDDGLVTPPEARSVSMTKPQSHLQGYICPCNSFRGWKGINLKGKMASKSFGDLAALNRWDWEVKIERQPGDEKRGGIDRIDRTAEKVDVGYPLGKSPLETLPMELLGAIIDQLATDIPPNGFTARNIDLRSLLLTSRGMHAATLSTLYKQITVPHSRIFRKFLSHIIEHPALGTIVRRLDFSHFNPTGAGQTARERALTLNLIPETLLHCLSLTPNLREFLAQEHVDSDMDSKVIQKLFCDLPMLKAVDFCACSSAAFRDSFNAIISAEPCVLPEILPIQRLGLHECTVLPATTYTTLLPRLPHLTHLDVAHTRITDSALLSIPTTAHLTHLNLSKCQSITGAGVVEFLSTHPAAKTLVYLNLAMDAKSSEMLSSEDITALLPVLPSSLRTLNLKGSRMDRSHIPALLPLTKHLEELGLGRHLILADICKLFTPNEDLSFEEQLEWIPHSLHYVDVSDLSLAELDLGTLFATSCPVLKSVAAPLEVLELSPEVFKKLDKSQPVVKRAGWCLKEAGRRGWLVRIKGTEETDTGARGWKWGASYWGMRKVPVARAEVGGMYGHYMFKR